MSNKFLTGVGNIDISDVNGLQDELTELEEEIASGGGNKTIETFTQQIGSTAAGFGEYKLYAKSDGFYERGAGAEVKLAGGSSGTNIAYTGGTPAISDGMVFSTGISREFIQNDTGFRLDTTNNKLVVPDIETDEHFSINSTLTNIDFNESTSVTSIEGLIDITPTALLNVKSATNATNSVIIYPEGKAIRFVSGGVQQGEIKLNAGYNNILELSGAASLITQNVPNSDYSITNKLYVDGLTGKSYDAIPSAFGNSLTTSTTANFFLRNNMPYKMTINKIRVSVYAAGSGVTRMGVYRGSDTNAVLVGESSQIAAGSLTTFPRYEYTITAVSGQTLLFSKNESYIVALCLDGSSTRFRAFDTGSSYATNDDQWYRTTETPDGFPSTPGAKSATATTAFCYCLVES